MSIKVLLVEDSPAQAAVFSAYLAGEPYFVTSAASGEEALRSVATARPDIILLDLQLPGIQGLDVLRQLKADGYQGPIIIITDHGSVDNVAESMRVGAVDFLTKPFDRHRLQVTISNALLRRDLHSLVATMRTQLFRDRFHGFIGASPQMQSLYKTIETIAPSKASVFITGESGTGKELCAAAIHAESGRRDASLVAVNCAALPRELMESEIFGHVKGAFTGAHRQREGAAMLANGGTLFLDEIGEMDLDLQSKLLRFVQTGQFQRVGSGEVISTDVRIVCATNRDPMEMIRTGRFRADLFYRLHVVPVHLPPLRDRSDDILRVAREFLSKFSAEESKRFDGFATEAELLIQRHTWPGNVRELENVIRNVVVLNSGGVVTAGMLPASVSRGDQLDAPQVSPVAAGAAASPSNESLVVDALLQNEVAYRPAAGATVDPEGKLLPLWQVEKLAIERAIRHFDGNVPRAAAALQVSPSTLYRKRQSWEEAADTRCAS